jgi:hypothetical protein
MVWCAKESADFAPGSASAMQFFKPYGWIHWDVLKNSWHTVTGYELGDAGKPVEETEVQLAAALAEEHPGRAAALAGVPGEELAPDAPSAAPLGDVAEIPIASAIHAAGPPPPSAADPSGWDTDHKRDEDRADTQHTLDNTRWDTQHTLDNTRWDTRHTLDNTRWDTSLALKRSREDTALATDAALLAAVHGGYIAVAQGSLDRAVQRATYVTTAAGAIATLYTAVLAARYTVNHEAPARSLLPALFIGAAVVFSTWYMAFLRSETRHQQLVVSGTGGKLAETRLLDFMEWTFSGVLARAWSLRVSVISLGLGLALLPIGMVQLSSGTTWLVGIAGTVLLVLWLAGEAYIALDGPGVAMYRDWLKRKPPKLAPERPTLPGPPRGGFKPTGAPSYGMVHAPPAAPSRSAGDDPPPPPEVAVGSVPQRPDLLAPEPRPAPPKPSPAELRVDVQIADGRPGH